MSAIEHKEYYANDNLKCVYTTIDGVKQGVEIGYTITGEKKYKHHYIDNLLNGECKEYSNKKLIESSSYKNGKLHGIKTIYMDNKKKIPHFQYIYKDGALEGNYKEWYIPYSLNSKKKNNVKCVIPYKNGKKHGNAKQWFQNGNLNILSEYKDDKVDGEYKLYNDNGNLKISGKIENDYIITNINNTLNTNFFNQPLNIKLIKTAHDENLELMSKYLEMVMKSMNESIELEKINE